MLELLDTTNMEDFQDFLHNGVNMTFNTSKAMMSTNSTTSVFRSVIHYLDIYMVPIICFVGLTGNLLSFVVFVCTYMRRSSSSVYLAALAITDTLFLICLLVSRGSQSGNSIYTRNGWCQTFLYVTYLSSFLSVWYVVSFTCERYISVNYPLRRQQLCTKRRAKLVVCSLAAFAAVLYSFGLWTSGVNIHYGMAVCGPTSQFSKLVLILHNIDTFITLILPFLAIVVMNVRIVYKVVLFYRNREHMSLDQLSSTTTTTSNTSGTKNGTARNHVQPVRFKVISTRTQAKVTKMLLIVSTMFLLLNLPRHTARAYSFFLAVTGSSELPSATYLARQKIFQFLYYTHFAVNLFLYSMVGKNFRKAFLCLCRRIKHRIVENAEKLSCICSRNSDNVVLSRRHEIALNDFEVHSVNGHESV